VAGHPGSVTQLTISPDGKQLATGGVDHLIHVVSTRFLEPPCSWAIRNLSLKEGERYFPGEAYRKTCPELTVEKLKENFVGNSQVGVVWANRNK
jgi:WD40 repeat protein